MSEEFNTTERQSDSQPTLRSTIDNLHSMALGAGALVHTHVRPLLAATLTLERFNPAIETSDLEEEVIGKLKTFARNVSEVSPNDRFDEAMEDILWRTVARVNYFCTPPPGSNLSSDSQLVLKSTDVGVAYQAFWKARIAAPATHIFRNDAPEQVMKDIKDKIKKIIETAKSNKYLTQLAALAFYLYAMEAVGRTIMKDLFNDILYLAFWQSESRLREPYGRELGSNMHKAINWNRRPELDLLPNIPMKSRDTWLEWVHKVCISFPQ